MIRHNLVSGTQIRFSCVPYPREIRGYEYGAAGRALVFINSPTEGCSSQPRPTWVHREPSPLFHKPQPVRSGSSRSPGCPVQFRRAHMENRLRQSMASGRAMADVAETSARKVRPLPSPPQASARMPSHPAVWLESPPLFICISFCSHRMGCEWIKQRKETEDEIVHTSGTGP